MTQHFEHDLGNPENGAELMQQADKMMGGGFSLGITVVVWMLVVYGLNRRGFTGLNSFIAANFTTALGSFLLFIGGFMQQEIPVLWGTVFAFSVTYSYVKSGR